MSEANSKNQQAIARMLRERGNALRRMIVRKGVSPQDADEVLQQLHIKVLRYLGERVWDDDGAEYLFATAVRAVPHVVTDYQRKRRRHGAVRIATSDGSSSTASGHRPVDTRERTPPSAVSVEEQAELLKRCMARLSPQDRMVIEKRYFDRNAVVEIAEQVGCTANAVTMRLRRALDRLRRCLAEEGLTGLPLPPPPSESDQDD